MKTKTLTLTVAMGAAALFADNIAPRMTKYNENPTKENLEARELFRQRGFGLFIHYGLYAVSGEGEWQLFSDSLDTVKYRAERQPFFKPKKGCVDEWIKLAKDAGMRYIVLTTRHHEGYWLGDDFIREYTTKVREAGLGVGVYFSVADWSDAGYRAGNAVDPEGWKKFVDRAHRYLKHLMSDFGRIEYLFYDGCPPPAEWDLAGINAEMRRLQPQLLICRGHLDCDFKSCEGNMSFDGAPLWESCYTFNHSWGYNKRDFNFKPLPQTAMMFYTMRHNGGNFLLNVGPMADGTVQPEAADRLRELGKWVKTNREALFDIVPHPFAYAPRELLCGGLRDRSLAYWMTSDYRCHDGRVIFGIANRVKRLTYLDSGEEIPFEQDFSARTPRLIMKKLRHCGMDDMPYIVKIELDGEPKGVFNERLPKYSGNRREATVAKIAESYRIKAQDRFHGYDRVIFDFKGHNAWVVFPKDVPVKGSPWTWTMQWATAFVPRTNVPKLLENGYHHVTLECFAEKMSPEGIALCADFQKYLVEELGFAPKANLIGMSWGGFFSVRYAAAHPENVRKIYLDCPLLNFADFRHGAGDGEFWKARAPKDPLDWTKDPEMPVNKAGAIARAGIPVLLLYGGADNVVPPASNCELFVRRFRAEGGDVTVVKRGAYGHHPHGVEVDETTIKDFFESEGVKPVASFPAETAVGERLALGRVKLDKAAGENAWYRLNFTVKGGSGGGWRVDQFDAAGGAQAGAGGGIAASKEWRDVEVMVPASPDAAEAAVVFEKCAAVRNVTMRRVKLDDAVAWCYDAYSRMPRLDYVVPKDCWEKLPDSKIGLKVAKNFNVLLLGDGLVNDSHAGLMTAIVQKAFPDTKIRFDVSVRPGAGCAFYREPANFADCVAKFRPNLVLLDGDADADATAGLVARCRGLGAEVAVCSPVAAEAARRSGAQFWDLATGPRKALSDRADFRNDDCEPLIVAMTFGEYFRAAWR